MILTILLDTALQKLISWDKNLFELINSKATFSFFDDLMPYIRNSNFWMPIYLFLLVFMLANFKKNKWWWILFFICTVAITDLVSSQFFKMYFQRLRPCNDPDFFRHVRLLVNHCSGGYSFTSSHAANHFGMAVFFFLTLKKHIGNWAYLSLVWAALICYAQVYVGVHYPLDIAGGAVIGILTGYLTSRFFNKRFGFAIFEKETTPTG